MPLPLLRGVGVVARGLICTCSRGAPLGYLVPCLSCFSARVSFRVVRPHVLRLVRVNSTLVV